MFNKKISVLEIDIELFDANPTFLSLDALCTKTTNTYMCSIGIGIKDVAISQLFSPLVSHKLFYEK